MDAKSLFMYGLMATGASLVSADLRPAATPKSNYNVQQRNAVKFVSEKVLSIEPSAFGYAGLEAQRKNAYDNFYRSNIDNEQDKRNFNTEAGQDHLPIRTMQADMDSSQAQNKLPTGTAKVTVPGAPAALEVPAGAVTATPGTPFVVPLRWNNPHSAELEVNVWLKGMTVVVPIKKPTCAGEGRQDAAFSFTIPTDFNTAVPAAVPGFTGCKQIGDCVLQYYAHSVEPRQYAHGVPLIVTGEVGPAGTVANIEAARTDPGTDLSKQPNAICLSSIDPAADYKTSVPRAARLISDVANHAYQNSDYSPYSGQQPEAISKNLQASVIIEMIPSNGGELGKSIRSGAANAAAAKLAAKVKQVVEAHEAIVNKIIDQIGDKVMKNNAQIPAGVLGTQPTATTFRAAEVGSVTTTRLKTTTYIPALKVPAAQIAAAKALVPAKFAGLVTDDGTVQLYQQVLNSLKADFNKAAQVGLAYMGPVVKDTPTTMQDATQFKKLNAAGKKDNGVYASQQFKAAQATRAAAANKPAPVAGAPIFTIVDDTLPLLKALSADDFDILGALGSDVDRIIETADMDQVTADTICDKPESTPQDGQVPAECSKLTKLFVPSDDAGAGLRPLSDAELAEAQQAAGTPKSETTNAATTATASFAAAAFSLIAAVFLA